MLTPDLSFVMPICNLSDLPALCPDNPCLLGLDPGSAVIGVAISDPSWRVASPLVGIRRGKFTEIARVLGQIIHERHVGALVIGLPKNLDGSEGTAAQSAKALASNLLKKGQLPNPAMPIVFWDERFSTVAVTRFMLEDDMSRKRRSAKVDQAAAAYILQGALDALTAMASKGRSG
jgi:putative holliday junction resolvase